MARKKTAAQKQRARERAAAEEGNDSSTSWHDDDHQPMDEDKPVTNGQHSPEEKEEAAAPSGEPENAFPSSSTFEFDIEANMTDEAKSVRRKESGTAAYKLKKYDEAIKFYTEAIQLDPTHTAALFNRAAAYMAAKRYQLALSDCQSVLSKQGEPAQSKTLARLGKVQLALGQVDSAQTSLVRARETAESAAINPIQADLAKIGRIQSHLSSIERERRNKAWGLVIIGVNQATQEVEEAPVQWRIWKLEALVQRKNFQEATFFATDIVRSAPSNPDALYWRGQIFYQSGNFDQAKIHFERALGLDPDFSPVIPWIKKMRQFENRKEAGRAAFAKKSYADAITAYTAALEIDTDNEHMQILFRSNRALAQNALKNYAEAITDCEAILKLQPTHYKALRSKARAELGLEQYEEAVQSFTAAFEAVDSNSTDRNGIKAELDSATIELKRSKQRDYYKELGLRRTDNPSEDEIKKAYKRESLKNHPDKPGGSEDKFKVIGEAYSVLSDPQKRRRYDAGEDIDGSSSSGGMQPDFADMFGGGGGFGGSPFGHSHGGFGGGGNPFGDSGGINLEDLLGGGGGMPRSRRGRGRPF